MHLRSKRLFRIVNAMFERTSKGFRTLFKPMTCLIDAALDVIQPHPMSSHLGRKKILHRRPYRL